MAQTVVGGGRRQLVSMLKYHRGFCLVSEAETKQNLIMIGRFYRAQDLTNAKLTLYQLIYGYSVLLVYLVSRRNIGEVQFRRIFFLFLKRNHFFFKYSHERELLKLSKGCLGNIN